MHHPLQLDGSIGAGDPAVVQGYPHGGPFQSVPARVISTNENYAPDIYETSTALRSHPRRRSARGTRQLRWTPAERGWIRCRNRLRPGRHQGIGYAMTTAELEPLLAETAGLDQPIATGSCIE